MRAAIEERGLTAKEVAEHVGIDPKSVQRWITKDVTPRRSAARAAAGLLGVKASYLWPELETPPSADAARSEVVELYPHRSSTPRRLWMDLLADVREELWLFANASLFLPEENPESIPLIRRKASQGVRVRILMGDPDSPEMELRGVEERLYEAIPARIRMALAYYSPLVGVPGITFLLHRTSLYNSIFRYDDQMLINQHAYGTYGYLAPILHLRRMPGGTFFETYINSFERVWETARPIEESTFWQQRTGAAISAQRPAGS
nr:helix-turn-helix domain-containing protein [Actinomadura rayongensis]